MEWQDWGKRLIEVLDLKKSPVAVTYTDVPVPPGSTDRCRACGAIFSAAKGETIQMTATNSACPGGSEFLGLSSPEPGRGKTLRDFLINGEKLYSCPAAIHRMRAMTKAKPPVGMAEAIVFAPLDRAELQPDIAIVLCNAWQASRLIGLASYETGLPMECDPTGALCRAVVTYPLVTGQVNVSFGDVTARRTERAPEGELYVSLPYQHLRSVALSIDRCGAGTASLEIPETMRQVMQEDAEHPQGGGIA
jgi:uncharacterized protein (DUF169 family)